MCQRPGWTRPTHTILLLAGLAPAWGSPLGAQTTVSICDRTAAVRDSILSRSGAGDCASVTSSQLASVSELNLTNSGISSLKSGDFAGLSRLNRLQLYGNELETLPSDVFSGLSSLQVLLMSYNSFTTLPSDVFSGLTSLVELSFSHNEVTTLPDSIFHGLSSLNYLYLDGNAIATLPEGIFSGLTELNTVFLYGNAFTTFPTSTFSGLTKLNWITMEGGALTSLPAGAFSGLPGLRQLDLSNNSLTSIPGDAFSGSTAIHKLILSGNNLTSLPDGVFAGLSELDRALWLQGNDVDPMPLEVSLESTGDTVRVTVPAGAPFDIRVPLSATNGSLDSSSVTVSAGKTASPAVVVTRSDTTKATTVDLGTLPGLPSLGTFTHYWRDENPAHHGYVLKRSADVPLSLTGTTPTSAVTLVLTPASISESGDTTIVTATASPAAAAFSVTVSAAAVSPATSSDFTLSGTTLSFSAGDSTSTGTVTIIANDNNVDAADKTVTVSGTIATSGASATAPANRTLTITDDDEASTSITLSASPAAVAEDDDATTVTVTAALNASARASATDLTISVGSGSGSNGATSGTDFGAVEDFTLTIPAVSTSGTATFDLTPTDDSDAEADESVSVTGSVNGLTVTGTSVMITNDDETPSAVTLVLTPASISENGDTAIVTATASPPAEAAFSVTVSAAAVSPATSSDFTLSGTTLSFAAGDSTSTGTVRIIANDNDVDAADKTVTVSGAIATSGASATAPSNRTLTINDDDEAAALTAEFRNVPESHDGDAAFTFRIAFSEALASGMKAGLRRKLSRSGADLKTMLRVDNRLDLFEVKLEPKGDDDVIISLGPSPTDCTAADAVCTSGGAALIGTVTDTVPGPSETPTETPADTLLTAEFKQVPASHDGTVFTIQVAFSEELANGAGRKLRRAISGTGGSDGSVRRVGEARDLFTVEFEPSGTDDVIISLVATTDCAANDALCTSEGKALSNAVTDTVPYASSSIAGAAADGGAVADALAAAAGVTPDEAAAALFGKRSLGRDRLDALDRLGNRNGRYDLGDLLSWIDRCRRGEATCDETPADSGPAGGTALPGAARGGGSSGRSGGRAPSRTQGRAPGAGERRPVRRRRKSWPGWGLAAVLTAAMTWSCTDGAVGPAAAEPDPGFLTVELAAPPPSGAIGVLLELSGPGMDSLRAPGRDLIESDGGSPRHVIVAGSLTGGPLLQLWVPDRGMRARYRVSVVEVASEDFSVEETTGYVAIIR